jgi:hypothetical protein
MSAQRYFGIVFHHSATRRAIQLPDILGCDVNVISSNLSLTIDTDESYTLEVIVSGCADLGEAGSSCLQAPRIQITAQTAYGALRAIETFAQLVYRGAYINGVFV